MGGVSSSLLYSLKIMTMFLPAAAGRGHTSALSTRPRALEFQHLAWLEAGQYCTGHQQRTPTASPQTAVWRNIIQTSFAYMTCYSADKRTHLHMKSNLTTRSNNNIEARKYLLTNSFKHYYKIAIFCLIQMWINSSKQNKSGNSVGHNPAN